MHSTCIPKERTTMRHPTIPSRRRTLIGAAIGLCVTMPPTAAEETNRTPKLTVTPGEGSLLLIWEVPPEASLKRLVVRYRIDGPAPMSLTDGRVLFDVPATPGTTVYKARHSRLSSEHTYAYAAFGLDASGAVCESTEGMGIPLAVEPPMPVTDLRRAAAGGGQ